MLPIGFTALRRMSGQHSPGFDCRPGTTVIQLVYLTPAMPALRVASLSRYDRYANFADLLCMCYLLCTAAPAGLLCSYAQFVEAQSR